ncbi:S-layer homology domain-containing protein [Patescibacteria group bacterium]|nr:S-layer homology domain-containing protein [Patescibacteria group bacterium]
MMNTKFVHSSIPVGMTIMILVVFLLTGIPVNATTSGSSGYNAPILMNSMNFKATLENGAVHTSWTPYAPNGFNYYKVIRSTTNPDPVYPDDSYIKADSNPDASSYVDLSPKSETAYYRVCSIASPNRYCSNVITINGSGSASVSNPDLIESATLTLSGKIEEGKVRLSWTADRSCPNGFKIAKSNLHENPTYPAMSGDTYRYLSDPDAKELLDDKLEAGKTYHYRVCQYNGSGGCISYSNQVSFAISGSASDADKEEADVIEPATITLVGNVEEGFLKLEWLLEGSSPNGFKIAKSTVNENPTCPPMDGDTYKYLSSYTTRQLRDFNVSAGKTYHYRVCQYDGSGGCISYSNAVALTAPGNFVSAKETTPTYEEATGEKEVSDTNYHQYKTAVEYLLNKKIVQGYDDGTFRPDNLINRAEFMKIVIGAKYSQDYISVSSGGNCFSDVRAEWFAPYVCIAKDEGIVGGYPDGTFQPGQNISFAEAAKILAETYGLNVTKGGSWYEGYVKALQENNYIPSTVGTVGKTITRAEMAELIWRIKEEKRDQASSTLIQGDVIMESGEYAGWKEYSGDGFSFYHPNWYQGIKWGRVTLTEELDFYQNFNTPNYMAIDTYMHVYTVAGSNLNTSVWFDHPFVSSQELTINGVKVLKRHFRAPRGTVVSGRTTGENENITIYTYQLDGKVAVLHYFNAYGSENKDVEIFYKIAESFRIK